MLIIVSLINIKRKLFELSKAGQDRIKYYPALTKSKSLYLKPLTKYLRQTLYYYYYCYYYYYYCYYCYQGKKF